MPGSRGHYYLQLTDDPNKHERIPLNEQNIIITISKIKYLIYPSTSRNFQKEYIS